MRDVLEERLAALEAATGVGEGAVWGSEEASEGSEEEPWVMGLGFGTGWDVGSGWGEEEVEVKVEEEEIKLSFD
jgi:hypothetical protein